MREIKFRAWDRQMEEMSSFGHAQVYDVFDLGSDLGKLILNQRSFILMQYTGLKDKNGKEIYEGDKLRTEKGVTYEIFFSPKLAKWSGRTLNVWTDELTKYFYKSLSWIAPRAVIIGNIYGNPELLET